MSKKVSLLLFVILLSLLTISSLLSGCSNSSNNALSKNKIAYDNPYNETFFPNGKPTKEAATSSNPAVQLAYRIFMSKSALVDLTKANNNQDELKEITATLKKLEKLEGDLKEGNRPIEDIKSEYIIISQLKIRDN